ncbi:MAG: PilZ domain-containing protein [Proteobacteria bacterium]|nr:PilZ domain-containing protein [Pseudomonadota bacterium]
MTLLFPTMLETGNERRRQLRVLLSEPVALNWSAGAPALPATALNLSVGGLFVAGCAPHAVGERVTCRLLFTPREPLAVPCRVAWVQAAQDAGRPTGMGLQFEDLSAAVRTAVDTLVNRLRTRTEPSGLSALAIDPFCESGTWSPGAPGDTFNGYTFNGDDFLPSSTSLTGRAARSRLERRWLVMQVAVGVLLVGAAIWAVLLRFG